MTPTTSSPLQRRTYGGWRRPSSPGLGSLSLLPTLLLFLGLILSVVMLLARGIEAGAVTAVVFVVAMTPAVIKVNERPLYRAWLMRLSWWRIRRTKGHLYRSGLAGVTPQAEYRLPGLLAQSRVWEAQDTQGRTFALIEHPYDGSWTVVLDTNPTSGTLISAEDRDVRVAHWDGWLADLGREPVDVQWHEAGPVAAQESWSTYRHDSGSSMTFEMITSPRGTVHDRVLEPLLGSLSGIKRKRVALLYRPVDSADAPAILDLQVKAALNRAGRRGAVVHAHDSAEVRSAVQAAAEEATGAGVTHLGILVSVSMRLPRKSPGT